MRPKHTQHPLPSFPVYSCAFLADDRLVLGGGGGASRSGIKNKLRLYEVTSNRDIHQKSELELEKGEDAPMSMAVHPQSNTIVCGINSTEDLLEKGQNENCRAYTVSDTIIAPLRTQSTLSSGDLEDYQKVTVLSPDGTLLAVAGAHDLSLLSFPSLAPVSSVLHIEKEIYDITFGSDSLIVATTHNLLVYGIPSTPIPSSPTTSKKKKGKGKSAVVSNGGSQPVSALTLSKSLDVPSSVVGEGGTFRSIKIHPSNPAVAYALINTVAPRSRQKKTSTRQGYVVKWNTESWTIEKSRKLGDKGITCFEISPDGRFLGFGSSDLSIGLVDATNLAPCATILKAHEFPPTVIKFNPSSTLLVSGSADNSIRLVNIPAVVDGSGSSLWIFLVALIIVLLAFFLQVYLGSSGIV